MKRAFTLIELLVVIAIIAILAAILFPVFAQAKESAKMTAVLSQYKQMGTAFIMYGSDADDNFPLAMGRRPAPANTWGYGVVEPVPANNLPQDGTWSQQGRIDMANSMWANSTYPYAKSYALYTLSGGTDTMVTGDVPTMKTKNNLTMNGLLHGMSQTSINSPSVVPMLWPGGGSQNEIGRAFSTPALLCGTQDCQFNPNGNPGSDAVGTDSFYVYSLTASVWPFSRHRGPFVRTDSSAKALPIGTVTAPNYIAFGNGVLSDPEAEVTATGYPVGYWPCSFDSSGNVVNGTYNYTCYFRPDRTK